MQIQRLCGALLSLVVGVSLSGCDWWVAVSCELSPCEPAETEPTFNYSWGRNWILKTATVDSFDAFLEAERQELVAKLPGLVLPARYPDVTTLFNTIDSGSTVFANRKTSCGFLERVRSHLPDDGTRLALDAVTHSGSVCVSSDLPEEERDSWVADLALFFWNRAWIQAENKSYSLKSWVSSRLEEPDFIDAAITVVPMGAVDGYGFGVSAAELQNIKASEQLSRLFAKMAKFDPTEPNTFGGLGPSLQSKLAESPYENGEPFVLKPSMYLGGGWTPFGLVEVLVHEYAHVYHLSHAVRLTESGNAVTYTVDKLQGEGFAESFTWSTLVSLYADYPEVEVVHVAKLQAMGQLRPEDPHYAGAAAFYTQFHRKSDIDVDDLKALGKSADLSRYIDEQGVSSVVDGGPSEPLVIPVEY